MKQLIRKTDSNSVGNTIRYYSNFIMIALYLALGLLFFFTDIAQESFPMYRKPIGAIMMVYACIRAFMVYRKRKTESDE